MESPYTPEQDASLKIPETEERAHYFWHVDTRRDGETLEDVAQQHGIVSRTGRRWRQERAYFGDERRVRKRKAAEKNHKLGRPFRVSIERLNALFSDETNLVREAPLDI